MHRRSLFALLIVTLVPATPRRSAGPRRGRSAADDHAGAAQIPLHGTSAGRAHRVGFWRARGSQHLLPRLGIRRRVEIDRRRPDVRADLRRSECRRDRIDRRRRLAIHNIVWVGTGEPWVIRYSDVMGDGVYKSTDAGKTWQHMGLVETGRISRVLIHPTDPNIVYVCAQGRLTGPQEERGVFKIDRRRRQLAACPVRGSATPAARVSTSTSPTRTRSSQARGKSSSTPGRS